MPISRRARLVIGPFLFAPTLCLFAPTALGARAGDEPAPPRHGVARIGAAPRPLSSPPRLLYYGGRVVSNARVVAVFWGTDVDSAVKSGIGGFYAAVTASPYIDWLSEYDTAGLPGQDAVAGSNQRVGRGSFAGAFTITPSSSGPEILDSEIQAELARQLRSGFLPPPSLDTTGNVNTIYMVHFPRGLTIVDQDGNRSCVQFCAYHGTIVYDGRSVPYGVLPDLSGMCDGACGTSPVKFENQTSVASHELVEAITDPEVGLCQTVERPLAWYDSDQGEIGDVCNGLQDALGSYVVQQEWSNVYGACIAVPPSGTNDFALSISPSGAQLAPGSATTFTVSTTALRGPVEPLALSVSGAPAGVTATLSPESVPSGGTSTVTLTAAPEAGLGVVRLDVTATGTSATHTASATLTVAAAQGASNAVRNGTFEAGRLEGWTVSGTAAASTDAHAGSWSARLGGAEPSADSTISQSFLLPSNASQLSFWFKVSCPDTVTFDWATATLTDETTGVTTTLLPKTCTQAPSWQNVATSVESSAGHQVTLTLANHDDDWAGDATWSAWDDVQVVIGSSTRTDPTTSLTHRANAVFDVP